MNYAINGPKVDTVRVSLFQRIRQPEQNHRRERVSGESGVKRTSKTAEQAEKCFGRSHKGMFGVKGKQGIMWLVSAPQARHLCSFVSG